MNYSIVESDADLVQLCDQLARSQWIGFDTEFVSEDCFRPDLCLLQVACGDLLAIIDPVRIKNLRPFWDILLDPNRTVVVHAGREETLFCYRATGQMIPNLFDMQLAAGFIGLEYPASYASLLQRLLSRPVDKGETRTDWRARPLSRHQLDYAISDVAYLADMHHKLAQGLERLGRTEWFREETQIWQSDLQRSETEEQWHRISGCQSLSGRNLAILRELWLWRHRSALQRNLPPRRILRDDLLIELAKRGVPDPDRIANVRGMHHPGMKQYVRAISEAIERGISGPEISLPERDVSRRFEQSSLLTQTMAVALAAVCRSQQIAPMIVGTADDLREWIVYRLGNKKRSSNRMPALLSGWRAEIVGKRLDAILSGESGLFVVDPRSDVPVEIVPRSVDIID